ncbi:hypothetical protein V7S79_03840 [Aquirufa sp. ROCK-SH2]
MQNIDFLSFGTFGSPNGFNQTSSNNLTYKSFDLNPNAIKLFPNSILYSIRKEDTQGINSLAYSIYTFAKERNSDRSGTFIGSSFIFNGEIPSEIQIINGLNNFHQNIIQNEKNVKGNVIQVSSSNDLEQFEPINFNELISNQKIVKNLNYSKSNKDFAIYIEEYDNRLISLLENSIELLNEYDTIFFTKSKEIAKYIQEKNLIEITNNDGFYKKIDFYREKKKEEILQKLNQGINQLERTKNIINSDFEKIIEQIDLNIRNHKKIFQENQSILQTNQQQLRLTEEEKATAKRNSEKLIEKIENSLNDLKSGKLGSENIISINEKYKAEFEKIKNSISPYRVERVTSFQKEQEKNIFREAEKKNHRPVQIENPAKNESSWLIILVFVFLFISIMLNGYFFLKKLELETKIENYSDLIEEKDIIINEPNQPIEVEKHENGDIWKDPNSTLNSNDLKKVNNKLTKNEPILIDSVIEIIFKLNPTDINKPYGQNKTQYRDLLLNKNPNSFQKSDNSFYWKNELKEVPIYKNN